jgi:protein-tyrosine phosphatase
LSWIKTNYEVFKRLAERGAWMQITSGSLTGRFGKGAKYWGERMLDEGLVHILATDAHSISRRAPLLAEGQKVAEKYVGKEEAHRLVYERPRAILDDIAPARVTPIPALLADGEKPRKPGFWRRLTAGRR